MQAVVGELRFSFQHGWNSSDSSEASQDSVLLQAESNVGFEPGIDRMGRV